MSFKNEKIVETKSCQKCQTSFSITDKDLEFYDKVSPIFGWEKMSIPTPILCPECRNQRRLSFWNERNLYKRECDATGKSIISIYSPDKVQKVYNQDIWWSDNWDAMDYGRNFDFSRSFFEQYKELYQEVPSMHLYVDANENSDYVNWTGWAKNLYMCFSSDHSQDSFYSGNFYYWKDSSDCLYCYGLENSYECVDCRDSNGLYYSQNCSNCDSSYFLLDCVGSSYCFASYGLRNAKYMIFNQQYTQSEYVKKITEYLSLNWESKQQLLDQIKNHLSQAGHKFYNGENNENSNGDFIINCKNAKDCFDCLDVEDSKYSYSVKWWKDLYDIFKWGHFWEKSYECFWVGENISNLLFCNCVWGNISDSLYSSYCVSTCKNLFGCVWLRNKQYCILNKQYTQDEYEKIVPKIIEKMREDQEWWEFFPAHLSPFGYNETVGNEYFPLRKGEAEEQWFNWSEYSSPFPKVDKTILASQLPDDIKNIPDDILNWAIECEVTKKPFRIIPQELKFYRKHNLPIPKRHPDQRHLDRMAMRNPRKLFERACYKCSIQMQTTYSPERPERVYCEDCYNAEVY